MYDCLFCVDWGWFVFLCVWFVFLAVQQTPHTKNKTNSTHARHARTQRKLYFRSSVAEGETLLPQTVKQCRSANRTSLSKKWKTPQVLVPTSENTHTGNGEEKTKTFSHFQHLLAFHTVFFWERIRNKSWLVCRSTLWHGCHFKFQLSPPKMKKKKKKRRAASTHTTTHTHKPNNKKNYLRRLRFFCCLFCVSVCFVCVFVVVLFFLFFFALEGSAAELSECTWSFSFLLSFCFGFFFLLFLSYSLLLLS